MRNLLLGMGVAAGLLLGACSTTQTQQAQVTIAEVQAQAQILTTALAAGATAYEGSPTTTATEAAAVEAAMTKVAGVNSIIQGNQNVTTLQTTVASLGTDVQEALSLFQASATTQDAVAAALIVIDTWLAEQQAAAAPATS